MEQEFEKEYEEELRREREDPEHVLIKVKGCCYCGNLTAQMYIRKDRHSEWVTYENPVCHKCRDVINYEIARWRKKV